MNTTKSAASFEQLASRLGIKPLIRKNGTPKGFYMYRAAVRFDFKRNCPDRICGSASLATHGAYPAYRKLLDRLEANGRLTEGEKIILWRAVENFFVAAAYIKGA